MQYHNQNEYGRIRLYESTSTLLRDLLYEERNRLCLERKERAPGQAATPWNRAINKVDQVLHEINRMRVEKGWSPDGEPFGPDS